MSHASSRREHELAVFLSPSASFPEMEPSVIEEVASFTQRTNQLLGTKSIGVDYGLVRTGLAVTVGFEPTPLTITNGLNNSELCQTILQYAKTEQASRIIVGMPLHKNGTLAEQTNLTIAFAQVLLEESLSSMGPAVTVELWDERYTSKEAASRIRSVDPQGSLRGNLDADSACIILEHYYKENGEGSHRVDIPAEVRRQSLEKWEDQTEKDKQRLDCIQKEREGRITRRKEAMAQARAFEESTSGLVASRSKKKKKKKRK